MIGTSQFLGSGLECNHLMYLGKERRQEWMMRGYQPSCWGRYSQGRCERVASGTRGLPVADVSNYLLYYYYWPNRPTNERRETARACFSLWPFRRHF
jgi:hypothetical protein